MYFHLGRHQIGQDRGMFAHVLYPRVALLRGDCGQGKSQPISRTPAIKVVHGVDAPPMTACVAH